MHATRALGLALLGLAGSVALAQEASPYEAVLKDLIDAVDGLSAVLGNVKDAASATEARPALKKAVDRILEVRKKAEALKQPDAEEREKIVKEYQKKLSDAVLKYKREVARVQTVPGGRDALQEIAPLDPPKKKGRPGKDGKKP